MFTEENEESEYSDKFEKEKGVILDMEEDELNKEDMFRDGARKNSTLVEVDSSKGKKRRLRSKNKNTSEDEYSYNSDDMTERAKRSRAFQKLKQQRDKGNKSGEKQIRRISTKPVDSETDESDSKEESQKIQNSWINTIYSDSSDEDPDSGDEDFVIDDDCEEEDFVGNELLEIKENLRRQSEKFQDLNEEYKNALLDRQKKEYDGTEYIENRYPPKLLDNLREARDEAKKDESNSHVNAADLSDDDLVREWEMYDIDQTENLDGECICGKTGLRWLYFMRNTKIENWKFFTRIVGFECINWFIQAKPNSSMVLLSTVTRGCTVYFRKKLSSGLLLMTLGGNKLPKLLADNQEQHKSEYSLPIKVTKLNTTTNKVDIDIKPPPGNKGKGFQDVLDSDGDQLVEDNKYQAYLKPVIKPCKNKDRPATIEFTLLKIKKQEDGARKIPVAMSFLK